MASEGLGRLYNLVVGSGIAINLSQCSAVDIYGTNNGTYTITVSTTFGSGYTSPGNIITHYYQNTDNGAGTGTWTKQTQSAADNVAQSSDYATLFTVHAAALVASGYKYLKVTKTSEDDGNPDVQYILHDLTVQRAPANLTAVSAA